jgi:hypothetical protein
VVYAACAALAALRRRVAALQVYWTALVAGRRGALGRASSAVAHEHVAERRFPPRPAAAQRHAARIRRTDANPLHDSASCQHARCTFD